MVRLGLSVLQYCTLIDLFSAFSGKEHYIETSSCTKPLSSLSILRILAQGLWWPTHLHFLQFKDWRNCLAFYPVHKLIYIFIHDCHNFAPGVKALKLANSH